MKQFKSIFVSAILLTAAHQMEAQVAFNPVPSRIVGQPVLQQQTLTAIAPNLVEGRELFSPQAVAVDTSSSPPIVYVADTNNNRVLAWRNPAALSKGDRAEKVIGQRDFLSTQPKGPGSDLSTGLTLPLALLVDKNSSLYVVDAGNNRVLRYPAPFTQTSDLLNVDLIIGQQSINGRSPNEGLSAPTAKTLAFSNGSSVSRAGLALDAQGNLWVSDPINNRVLRYPASALAAGQNELSADLVLGQSDFASRALPANATRDGKNYLAAPSGLAFDPQGRLFVADGQNRVLVYTFLSSGASAARIMGIILPTQQIPNPPTLNETTLGTPGAPPESIFFVGNNPFVVDRGNARILKFDPFDQWPAEPTTFSPKAIAVTGQQDFVSNRSNRGQAQPSEQTLSGPVQAHSQFEAGGVVSAVTAGNDLYVADAGNNRVLIFPQQSGGTFSLANRVLGQLDFQYNAPNLIEGREFFFPSAGASVIIDTQSNPPHLYVSDPLNNRVLGFRDYRTVKAGDRADLVIGQASFFTAILNFPRNDANQINDQGLAVPEGLAIDANSDLWVADFGNGRVLRFPRPFDQPQGVQPTANLVIGQQNFFTKITDASSQTMSAPYGVAFTASGHLLVSDRLLNRILFFRKPSGGDFVNGQSATSVIGQPDFGPHAAGSLLSPSQITVDSDDRLYVADTGNNRIVVYRNVPTAGIDPSPSFSLTSANAGQSISNPTGVVASQLTGEIWVANTGSNNVLRFPRFDTLVTTAISNLTIPSLGPLSVALDPFGNPVVAESLNRVAFYFPTLDLSSAAGGLSGRFSGNAANYFRRFAPGMLASIFSFTTTHFGDATAGLESVPAPTTLGDVSVFVAGVPSPLIYVSPSQINFQVPSSTPVGSFQEIQVVRASTGQVLASGLVRIDPVSPGLFTANSTGSGQIAALNEDNVRNDGTHPAKAGSIIQLFGTGQGPVSGAPPDGSPAALMQLPTDEKPKVYINSITGPVPDEDVLYSGLAPGFIGLWQINVRVPKDAPVGDVAVAVIFKGINSRLDEFGDGRMTTIRTTP